MILKSKMIDIRIVNYIRKTANNYLSKRNISFTEKIPGKLELLLTDYFTANQTINCIDIGAHKGTFVDEILRFREINELILIEPIPELAIYLRNKFQNRKFTLYQNAVSNIENDVIDFMVNEMSETSSLLEFNSSLSELKNINTKLSEKIKIKTRTLDSIVKECEISEIDLLKIDVQGAEHLVLTGATESLRKSRYIFIELSFKPLYANSTVFMDVFTKLGENGFILKEVLPGHRGPENELLQVDALFENSHYKLK